MSATTTPPDAQLSVKHHEPANLADGLALGLVKFLRFFANTFFQRRYGHRAVILETIAAVPGMVGGALTHLRSLRRFEEDRGWIKTLLDEAENERAHLMTFLHIAKPNWLERMLVVIAQGVFFNAFFFFYLFWPRVAHRFVGYLEEEAIVSYSEYLAGIDGGRIENVAAPKFAIDYWKLSPDARLREVVVAVRLDEAKHRDVNHGFADELAGKSDGNPGVRWALRTLGVAFATLSILLLIKQGFVMPSFAAPLQFVLNYYEALINVLLGWAEPYLHAMLAFLRDLLGLDLRLEAHWKHVTVLMMLFFCAVLRFSRMGGAIIAATFAILLSVGIGILLGTSWTSDATAPQSALLNGLTAALPLLVMAATVVAVGIGYAVTEAHNRGEHWWQYIMRLPAALLLFSALSLCIITFPLWIGGFLGDFRPDVQFLQPLLMSPRISLILIGAAAFAIVLVIWGALNAGVNAKRRDSTWRQEFVFEDSTRVGLLMLGAMGGATAFVACNAGLRLLDL
jgi:ubiquinol oxidase